MNFLKNKVNQMKISFNRSKSYPGCKTDKKLHTRELDDIMEVKCCTASYCETCEEMIFQILKKCKSCGERKICLFCYNDGEILCKDCNDELMEMYDIFEKNMNESIKKEEEDNNDMVIEDFVDQLL